MEYIQSFFASKAVNVVFTAVIALIVANIILNAVNKGLDKSTKINKTVLSFLKPVAKFLVYFFVCLFVANSLGFNTSSIVALASVFSAAIALAAQNVLSNLFGGVTLLLVHPFSVNDFVTIGATSGCVQSVGMFYTVLNTPDNKVITIPNGTVIGSTITNYSIESKRRVDLVVSASYDCKLDDVKKALYDAIAMTKNIDAENQLVGLCNYGESVIEYSVKVWTSNANYWQVYFDLLENVKRSFDKNGVVMSYNHIIVHQSKD